MLYLRDSISAIFSKTSDALGKLIDLAPKTANVIRNGTEVTIPAEEVKSGDTLIIRPGESIPVDGVIIEGEGSIDQSAVTGESLPVDKEKDDTVICATINKNGTFKMVATKVGNDTTLSQIIKLVDNASNTKAPIARLADKVSGIFVPGVIAISLVTFAVWLISGATIDFSLSMGITVLVISCPCALGLATPVAIMAGTGKAAESGILIKSAEALENLSSVDTIVLDKTGTITTGEMSVSDIFVLDKTFTEKEFLSFAYSLEYGSEHPLANAIKEKAKNENVNLKTSTEFSAEIGKGVSATIDGDFWFSGNYKFMLEHGIAEGEFKEKNEEFMKQGKTSLVFAKNKKAIGIIAISDTVKPESKQSIEALKKLDKRVIILTGDNASAAEFVASEVGADEFIAEVLPTDKERYVRELKEQGKKVCMIGDGINDSPALVTADVGMAIGAGTDIAIDSADIVLMKNSLHDAVTAFELSKKVLKNIKMNLFWAF
ncbi:MAG: copper-translocating P-type ATPase, partial [Clostridia bacterium]|nr:copper-translocating P-type ATPase [Clostridia bacterium]